MSDAKLKELGEDIKAHGQQTSIVIFVDNDGEHWLLDGISRLEAMQRIGLQVIENDALNILVVDWQEINDVDPIAYVLSANLHRRHLSARDKRELAANLLGMFPRKSDRQIAEMVGLSHPTIKVVRTELEARGKIFHVETRIDTRKREHAATKPPKPTSAAETDPIHHADHRHHDGGEHHQLAGMHGTWIGRTAAELNPADQAGAHHHGADQRAACTELDDLDGETLIEVWEAAGDTERRKIIQSLHVAALLDLMSADQRAALSEKIIGLQRRHSDFDAAKSEIVKLANESTAQLAHPAHNVDAIRKKLARIKSLADPDQKFRVAKPVAEKPLNTTLAHDAIKAANEAIAASSTTKH